VTRSSDTPDPERTQRVNQGIIRALDTAGMGPATPEPRYPDRAKVLRAARRVVRSKK
jgi:hypothetical protein